MLRSFARSSQILRLSRAASAESELILERLSGDDKGIAVISFNRPKAMNSFSKNMVKCMRQAIDGQFFFGLGNLSIKSRLRDRVFSSDSRQITGQGFYRAKFETGKQNRVKKEETGPVTVFKTEQGAENRPCVALKPVSGPDSRLKTLSWFPV